MKSRSPQPPPPPKSRDDKAGWIRQFTWNVSRALARAKETDKSITPAEAGRVASQSTRGEYRVAYKTDIFPEWMP